MRCLWAPQPGFLARHPNCWTKPEELCELLGTLTEAKAGTVELHEIAFLSPRTNLQVWCTTTPAGQEVDPTWILKLEGPILRGKELNDLPASVRPVVRARCYGSNALSVWEHSLGFKPQLEHLKQGQSYRVLHAGFPIQVSVLRVLPLSEAKTLASAVPLSGTHQLVEIVISPVADGSQISTCRAIESFARLVRHLVVLKR